MAKRTRLDWAEMQNRQQRAIERAAEVLAALNVRKPPVDPLAMASSEKPILRVASGDFKKRFDGQLEYHRSRNVFLLLFNTKYDVQYPPGLHHPRTRFSIAHELGHYFLAKHRAYLMRTGKTHPSRGEFLNDQVVEVEADAFAAGLLLPEDLFGSLVNESDLTFDQIRQWGSLFGTSPMSTARRAVELSHFPCALVGIQKGKIAYTFVSNSLIEGGCYPRQRGSNPPETAVRRWADCPAGIAPEQTPGQVCADEWFRCYDNERVADLPVFEYYHYVAVTETLLVLLTVPENELFPELVE